MVHNLGSHYRIHSETIFAAKIEWPQGVAIICINKGTKRALL